MNVTHRSLNRALTLFGVSIAILLLTTETPSAPKTKLWGRIVEISAPTVMTNWANGGSNSTTQQTLELEIQNLDEDILLTMIQADSFTEKRSNQALTTTWSFVTDGDGVTESGIQSSGSYNGTSHAAQGSDNFVSSGSLMSPGVVMTFVDPDEDVLLRITVSGTNAEDFGSDSDSTEAPDYSSSYDADMEIQLTWPVP